MKEFFKKQWLEFWLQAKKFMKIFGVLLLIDVFLTIVWFNLPEKSRGTLTNLANSAGLWFQNHQVLEKAHYMVLVSMRAALMFIVGVFFFSLIIMFLGLLSGLLLSSIKKEKRSRLYRIVMLSEVGISIAASCFVATREMTVKAVDLFMGFLNL